MPLEMENAIDDLRKILREFGDPLLEDIQQAWGQTVDVVEAKMVEITPEDTGFLAGSYVVTTRLRGRAVVSKIRATADYAAEVHELPEDVRGAKTRAKAGNEFGPAGPKYMQRVVCRFPLQKNFGPRYAKAIQDAAARSRRRT